MQEIFGLYDVLIKSEDIREYFKKEWLMTADELEKLIIHSHVPLINKLSYLITVRDEVAYGKDRKSLADMVSLYEKAVHEIYHNADERLELKVSNLRLESDRDDTELTSYFDTYLYNERVFNSPDVMFDTLSEDKVKLKNSHIIPYYNVVQSMRLEDGSLDLRIAYRLTWVNGVLSAIDFTMPEEFLEKNAIRKGVYYRKHETLRAYPLPFDNNSAVRIQTPMMRRPLHGKIISAFDEMNCLTSYTFKPYGDYYINCPPIDLSNHKIDMVYDWTVFDSVESMFMW